MEGTPHHLVRHQCYFQTSPSPLPLLFGNQSCLLPFHFLVGIKGSTYSHQSNETNVSFLLITCIYWLHVKLHVSNLSPCHDETVINCSSPRIKHPDHSSGRLGHNLELPQLKSQRKHNSGYLVAFKYQLKLGVGRGKVGVG